MVEADGVVSMVMAVSEVVAANNVFSFAELTGSAIPVLTVLDAGYQMHKVTTQPPGQVAGSGSPNFHILRKFNINNYSIIPSSFLF